ncbi:HD domain-containing protein [Myxococcota bacterium]|nr:HD domain-containing protein [Myxococcota bacterium]MBU1537590.1 HD domain-containing protein [Myxococcota bacterium]
MQRETDLPERKKRLFTDLVRALSLALDFEDGERLHHAWRVAILAYHIGRTWGYENPSILYFSGLLHDIGGITLDHHILHYVSPGRFEPAVHNHGEEGAHILEPFEPFASLIPVIRHHHEHVDGSGFPLGLKGNQVPLESSFILAADILDIHLRDQRDKNHLGHKILEQHRNTVLPGSVVDAALKLFEDLPDLLPLVFDPDSIKRLLFSITPVPPDLSGIPHLELLTQLLWVFARIIDSKHSYSMGHSVRTTWLACRIADGLPEQAVNKWDLIWAGLLHDAGEIGVPENILDKKASLTPFEWVVVKKHTQDTMQILSSVRDLEYLAYSASANHENYDGTGYPFGSRGEEIPLISRIIAIADAYDAMRSDRPHRSALPHNQALEELQQQSGTRFDPSLVSMAITILNEHGDASRNLANTHETFLTFFKESTPTLAPLLDHSSGHKHSTVLQGQSGVFLFELEPWSQLELSDTLYIHNGIEALASLCGPIGDENLLPWLVPESRHDVKTLHGMKMGETLTRYLFARSGTPMEAIFLRVPSGFTMLFRSAVNRIESFQGLTAFYRNFLSSSEAVVFTDPQGIITDVNRKFLDLYGYRIKDVIGHPSSITGSKETAPEIYQAMWKAISDRNRGTWSGELVNQTASGQRIVVQLTINSIRDASGKHLGYIGHTLDITARKVAQEALVQREAELRVKNSELQRLNDLKSDMVSITSHDLKSPINTILTITSFLRDSLDTMDKNQVEYFLSQIEEKGEQSIRFISDMLDLAKMESGNYEIHREVVHLTKLLKTVIGDHAQQAKAKEITLTPNPLPEHVTIEGDNTKLSQVFSNVVSNAIKFSPEGGTITIDLAMSESNTVRVTVDDDGPGIPDAERDSVFQKYYQVNKDQQAVKRGFGSGLGLYIVKNIVSSHGGQVMAERSPAGGTRIVIDLPLFGTRGGILLVELPPDYRAGILASLKKNSLCGVEITSRHLISPMLGNPRVTWVIMGSGPLSANAWDALEKLSPEHKPRTLLLLTDQVAAPRPCDRTLTLPGHHNELAEILQMEVLP